MSVWDKLSKIDCAAHIEKKGKFSYLAWTWAWAMVKQNYPDSIYTIHDDIVYPDGTMEVRCDVTVEGLTHLMWLPVLDYQNKPIPKPHAFDVNSARMRCLVKAIAMHGLGHYIYAGESTPDERVEAVITPEMIEAGVQLNDCLEQNDYHGAAEVYAEWSHEENLVICRAPSKGGELSTANRAKLKSPEFRHAFNEVRGITTEVKR